MVPVHTKQSGERAQNQKAGQGEPSEYGFSPMLGTYQQLPNLYLFFPYCGTKAPNLRQSTFSRHPVPMQMSDTLSSRPVCHRSRASGTARAVYCISKFITTVQSRTGVFVQPCNRPGLEGPILSRTTDPGEDN